MNQYLTIAVCCLVCIAPCFGATLLHHYNFDSDVSDAVGGVNGTLQGGAIVSGGVLNLDGIDDFVDFNAKLVPTSGSYSVTLFAGQNAIQSGIHTEFISQGFSSGPGFYIGTNPSGVIRLSDSIINSGVPFIADGTLHHYALVVDAGLGQTEFFIDGVSQAVFNFAVATTTGGSNTRFGRQFGNFAEFFHGQLDDIRIYNGALSTQEVGDLANAVPETSTYILFAMGILLIVIRKKN